jgi:hypothetical protein
MSSREPQSVESFGYHVTPAAAHPFPEIGRDLGAALGARVTAEVGGSSPPRLTILGRPRSTVALLRRSSFAALQPAGRVQVDALIANTGHPAVTWLTSKGLDRIDRGCGFVHGWRSGNGVGRR